MRFHFSLVVCVLFTMALPPISKAADQRNREVAITIDDSSRKADLHRLNYDRRVSVLWLADEQMKMFRHCDISYDHERVALTNFFKDLKK